MTVAQRFHQPELNQGVPDLSDAATLHRLSSALPAVIRMLEQLQVGREDQARLLALSSRSLQRALQGPGVGLSADQVTRMSFITGIYKALHILYDDDSARGWLQRHNPVWPFMGRTPLEHLLSGHIPAMQDTRRHLDAERSGQFSSTPEARRAASLIPIHIDAALSDTGLLD